MPDGSLGVPRAATTQTARPETATPRRLAVGIVIVAAAAVGALATGPDAASRAMAEAGADLTRLLRAMAAMKAAAALGLAAAVLWRLAIPAPAWRLAAYAAACAAMAAGPGLIWSMAHVRLGALLLHAGLLATVLLLWRDPATAARLDAAIAARRAKARPGASCDSTLRVTPPGLAFPTRTPDIPLWEASGGRAPCQPGQVRKEAAAVGQRTGRLLASHQD